ncbi:DUF2189 domain-containing protein [Salibacter halophilus]|uniref:DUF975 family protein n=1 Tax=Salibacter halophilus TaxID=1803916 RepID=A0A6N6MB13_9FLAO|nr:hypothetical protein [Salibacter halophilus]KAB1065621.1 hypothetical protein F3059_02915 [Salibacter halophilus]
METLSGTNDPLENGYQFKFNQYLNRGWELFKSQALLHIGTLVVFFIISVIAGFILGFIPVVGNVLANILTVLLYAGYFIAADKISRGQEPEFKDFFGGFNFFGPIALYQIVYMLIMFIALILPILYLLWAVVPFEEIIQLAQSEDELEAFLKDYFMGGEFAENLTSIIIPILLILIISIYVGLIYTITTPLIVLKKYGFWQAMETSRKVVNKKFFSFLLFLIVLGLINFAGAIFLGIGLLVTIPFSILATYAIYEDLYGGESSPDEELDVHVQ